MPGGPGRRQRGEPLNPWPGYVDSLSTLLMVIIFVLMVFVLAQGFLSVALSGRDRALDRLNRQVAELAELLSLERGQAEELRQLLGRTSDELRAATSARDAALRQLSLLREETGRAGADRDAARGERDRLVARLAEGEAAARGGAERIASLESRLAEALARAEAAGGDAAVQVRNLNEARRALAAERAALEQARRDLAAVRAEAEAARGVAAGERGGREQAERDLAALRSEMAGERDRLAALRAELAETQRMVDAMRRERDALDTRVRADAATIEARLSDLARLSEQVRALTALRDEMERRAAEALAAAGREAEARRVAETRAASEAQRRAAVELLLAEAARRTDTDAQARSQAEARAAEFARLGESARAQIALLTRQIETLREEIARLNAVLAAEEAEGRDRDAQIALLGQRLNAALAQRVEELQRYRSDFFGRLREVLGDRPDIRVVGDRFVFQSEVLFPVGSAEMSAAGEARVRDLARVLVEISRRIPPEVNWLLRVDGHADRTPIRGSGRFASNWDLSAARAIAVVNLLTAEGIPPSRLAAAGFGEFQPLDPGEAPDALARNRRIEFRLTDR
jgi:chemotaxis protein MotB